MADEPPIDAPAHADDHSIAEPLRRGRLARRIFWGAAASLGVLVGVAWWQRVEIADNFVASTLDDYGVRASYEIADIGVRRQLLHNVVIGDPQNPDLFAKTVEISTRINFSGVGLTDIVADGVSIRGRYANGKFSFGDLDKFRDPASKEPFDWPDIGVKLSNAKARLDTPWGVVGAGLEGSGLLRNRFDGQLSLRAPQLSHRDCTADNVRFDGRVLMEWREPKLIGPLVASSLACTDGKIALRAPAIFSDVKLSTRFDHWIGDIGIAAQTVTYGATSVTRPQAKLSIDGSLSRTNYSLLFDRAAVRSAPVRLVRMSGDAKGTISRTGDAFTVSARGNIGLNGGALDRSALAGLERLVPQTRSTPVGPLVASLIPALQCAADRFDGKLGFDTLHRANGSNEVIINALSLDSASGARLRQGGSLAIGLEKGRWQLNGPLGLAVQGPALPSATLSLAQAPNGQWAGNISFANYVAPGAKLSVPKLQFAGLPGGAWRFAGAAELTGPLAGGSIAGLKLPLDGHWGANGLSLIEGCRTIAFQSARISSLALRGRSVSICSDRGQPILQTGSGGTRLSANFSNLALDGMLGGSPFALDSAQLRFNLTEGFVARDVRVELGRDDAKSQFLMATLNGRSSGTGMAGMLSGAGGQIGNVPLLMSEAEGHWVYGDNILTLDGSAIVSDAQKTSPRFNPLVANDMSVSLENGMIAALGHLYEPKKSIRVADVDIRHSLGTGEGRALLAVDDLTFTEAFQPELITPLVLGRVANVIGTVSGDGRIEWDHSGVRSSGTFGTNDLDLAAAFGPVEGLKGQIHFDDLLGLSTPPGQVVNIASINPGIAALDGTIKYQLLPGQKVQVEGGRWPFAGGELILEPTLLDLGVETERRLTFRVIGMDAAQFLAPYGISNLQVTGIFDGTLPMVFDKDGGHIVGGALVSRPGGGEISYLGELSYKDMGAMANFAFDALKSIRYSKLEMGVGGNIAGEIVTDVSFTGLQQGSMAKRNIITKQLAKIPIQFNVSIKAQFLQLIGSIRRVYDGQYSADQDLPNILGRQGATSDASDAEKATPQETRKKEDEQNYE